jgi:hypothetical protein
MSVSARFTRDEYLALPASPPGVRFELLDGELVTMNAPLPVHQIAVARLLARLMTWCDAEPGRGRVLLPVDTAVGDATILGPDLQWFAPERALPPVTQRPWPVSDVVDKIASLVRHPLPFPSASYSFRSVSRSTTGLLVPGASTPATRRSICWPRTFSTRSTSPSSAPTFPPSRPLSRWR